MDRLLKDEFGLNRRAKMGIAACISAFLIMTIVVCFALYVSTRKVIVNQVTNNITNISQLNEDSVSRAILNR